MWAIERRGGIRPRHFASRLNGVTYHVVVEPDFWTILTAIGTVVALFGIIVALYFNRRSLGQDRKNAEATAARAESAARLSADSTDRIVAALSTVLAAVVHSANHRPLGFGSYRVKHPTMAP
jgi:hypothetical protein